MKVALQRPGSERSTQDGPEMDVQLDGPCVCRLYRMKNTPPGFWSRLIGRLVHVFSAVSHYRLPSKRTLHHCVIFFYLVALPTVRDNGHNIGQRDLS